jgi:hypothetical protein
MYLWVCLRRFARRVAIVLSDQRLVGLLVLKGQPKAQATHPKLFLNGPYSLTERMLEKIRWAKLWKYLGHLLNPSITVTRSHASRRRSVDALLYVWIPWSAGWVPASRFQRPRISIPSRSWLWLWLIGQPRAASAQPQKPFTLSLRWIQAVWLYLRLLLFPWFIHRKTLQDSLVGQAVIRDTLRLCTFLFWREISQERHWGATWFVLSSLPMLLY